ncbi:hypothetical protein APHAL10511_004579 [Amanita phalloides]|nr:hypothetical protein APHAL10511_004579 [Amanita phalloides]
MFEPVRGGTRGGQAEFKWSDVAADKDREHYLGHSINAPAGRWQKNKDIHWYNREQKMTESEIQEEVRKIKELEANALAAALGFEPAPKISNESKGASSDPVEEEKEKLEKEERRRKRTERKEQKRARKEARSFLMRGGSEHGGGHRHRSRSRSPRRRYTQERDHYHSYYRGSSPSSRVGTERSGVQHGKNHRS